MADHVMTFPGVSFGSRAKNTERRMAKSIIASLHRWYANGCDMDQRAHNAKFRLIADPTTGDYRRLY
jgi:hypothetical protein